jgi:hypothetical protein
VPVGFEQITRLREFYENIGVEFLGSADFATNRVLGAGVRFKRAPPYPPRTAAAMVPFAVARALLGDSLDRVGKPSGLSSPVVSRIEAGVGVRNRGAVVLYSYYRANGIEFLRSDPDPDSYIGIGARFHPLG